MSDSRIPSDVIRNSNEFRLRRCYRLTATKALTLLSIESFFHLEVVFGDKHLKLLWFHLCPKTVDNWAG